ncbi:cbb3-type cytochrome oxidase subunit 3 [Crenobacter cavernae]|uniref:Cbb3-type cytochrome c oxidase subunit 3 n=1 Tax=Crenobacter cavernae TaxID=2290923 RepID=A0A345Y2D6_9NEIS|nr:cbb3-type cytochrome c oxidase subunit 3 [Crenobacter cavernae]AXK38088.1 cbb3-type cytochrome c oxidase subunit 3 [Crenobacter cavernae]RXZ45498.1 cbb3-type cytochrome c oxidase subunit 3 [Crenobacter cavernae]
MDWTSYGHSAFTVFCLVSFAVILIGAYSKRAKNRYDEAAKLPFLGDEDEAVQFREAANGAKE